MLHPPNFRQRLAAGFFALCTLLSPLASASSAQAAPLAEPLANTTVELIAVEDQGMIESSPTFIGGGAPYFVLNGRPDTSSEDWNFMQFDLTQIPADATIVGAQLKLGVIGFGGPARDLEVGRVDGDWEEGVTSWSTMPPVTWGGPVQTITDKGEVTWPLKPLVEAWHNGAITNNGVTVRTLDNGNNAGAQARTKDGVCLDQDGDSACDYPFDLPPRLVITYSEPVSEGARPDLGDAPDSDSNHVGSNNTAYADGTLGHFPTVRDGTPANEGAGPRHNNVTLEAILGNVLSREGEADTGPDQDNNHNNILDGGADNANNDRGDDGWRNPTATFDHCRRTTLLVRVRKAPNAQRNAMYLNAWFDGNHDGDWQDQSPCPPNEGVPAPVANEWLIRDYVIPLNGIAAGGYVDIPINTERVLNLAPDKLHWLRLSLSEIPAPSAPGQLPDGRGPHPNGPLGAYAYGETEDFLVKPAPAGENGQLKLTKTVINPAGGVVPLGGLVTYQITLKQEGGSQPLPALIRDELAYGFRLFPQIVNGQLAYIVATSPTGGATPLQAEYRLDSSGALPLPTYLVGWNGSLAPDAAIKLSFLVQNLGICPPNQATQTVSNIARARPAGADTPITAEATFTAACPGYNPADIDFEQTPLDNPIDLDDVNHYPWHGTIQNQHPFSVTLGIYQRPLTATIQASAVLTTWLPPGQLLDIVTLKPTEKKPLDLKLRVADSSNDLSADDNTPAGAISFCLMANAEVGCPPVEHYPQLHAQVPFTRTVRPSDLGDAPDSTNHAAGVAMAAYPGVPANFPTVFDPATGLPPGPRHLHPNALHLGPQVSLEAEADIGPDQDPQNNLVPPTNDPDNDRFDDGSRLRNLVNCQPAAADVQVAITALAVNHFQQLGTPAYLNVWLDGNRDGDWADGFACPLDGGQPIPVVEHILIDYPINVVGLGAGLHNLANIATNPVPWPAQLADRPTWVRFTLSDRPANKPLNFTNIQYGDGRGYPLSFRTGETEDHYRTYGNNAPDLAVQLSGQTGVQPGVAAKTGLKYVVNYSNLGAGPALGGSLTFVKPQQLRDSEIVLYQTPGLPPTSTTFSREEVRVTLPTLAPGAEGTVVIGWALPGPTSTVSAAAVLAEFAASVRIEGAGDSDPSNNQATTTVRTGVSDLRIGATTPGDDLWKNRDTTCYTYVNLAGVGEAGRTVELHIGSDLVTVQADAQGQFTAYLTNFRNGRSVIEANYAALRAAVAGQPQSGVSKVRLNVDPTLAIDPMSLLFTNSQGRQYHPPTINWGQGAAQNPVQFTPGASYEIAINRCDDDPNVAVAVEIGATTVNLSDADGDGRYTGSFTYTPTVQTAALNAGEEMRFIVTQGASEQSFGMSINTGSGRVQDAHSTQALANATVLVLAADSGMPLAATTLGQPNPATTGADGVYSFTPPEGSYRLLATANGYQPYRSGSIEITAEPLAQVIALSPVVNEATTQRIAITASGFEPAQVTVPPGSVIEFVNQDVAEHSATASGWDSGLLATGESYKVKLTTAGLVSYTDSPASRSSGSITVGEAAGTGGASKVYLPVVVK